MYQPKTFTLWVILRRFQYPEYTKPNNIMIDEQLIGKNLEENRLNLREVLSRPGS
jgi:hypothetical protein